MKTQDSTHNPQNPTPNQGGRPTKMNSHILTAFREILEEGNMVLACTDKELFFMLNLRLDPEDQVCYRTFQRYKAKAITGAFDAEAEPLYQHLFRLFYEALIKQKERLITLILEGGNYWRKFQWILQRKFKEWSERFFDSEEAEEQVPWEPTVKLVVPYIPTEYLHREFALDQPMMNMEEWHKKFGDDLDPGYRTHCPTQWAEDYSTTKQQQF